MNEYLHALRCGEDAQFAIDGDSDAQSSVWSWPNAQSSVWSWPLFGEINDNADDIMYMDHIFDGIPDRRKQEFFNDLVIQCESSRIFERYQQWWENEGPLHCPSSPFTPSHGDIYTAGNVAAAKWLLKRGADPNHIITRISATGAPMRTALTNVPTTAVALCLLEAGAKYQWILERSTLPLPRVLKACSLWDPSFLESLLTHHQAKIKWDLEMVQFMLDCHREVPRSVIDKVVSRGAPVEALGAFFSFGLVSADKRLPDRIDCNYLLWLPSTHRHFPKTIHERVMTALLAMHRVCPHFSRDVRKRILIMAMRRKIVL